MRFFRQQPAYLIVSLCFLAASWSLWTFQSSSKAPEPTATLTSEDRARQALTDILGVDNFQLFLTMETRLVASTVEKKEYGRAVAQAEQTKIESLDQAPNKKEFESYQPDPGKDKDRKYYNEVTSRNYLVGETKSYEVSTRTETSKIRCFVVVKRAPQTKVDIARSALVTLLGVDEARGDTLTFQVEN